MLVRDIVKTLDAEILTGEENLELDIQAGCGADLMSDVMAFVKDNVILLTGLINVQVVRTAEMMDKVVCLPSQHNILANQKTIFHTVRGLLYKAGLTGRGVWIERRKLHCVTPLLQKILSQLEKPPAM